MFSQKTIENPAYELKVSGLTTIKKIEYSYTETKVYLHYSFLPKWWTKFGKHEYLEDCDTGKKYMIKEVVGIPFEKKTHMPLSSEKDFVLIYEPLDKGVKKINYYKHILGVSLTKQQKEQKEKKVPKKVKKWFKKELSKVKEEPLKDFSSPNFLNQKPAKLIGYIKGYDPRLGFETGLAYIGNSLTNHDPFSIKIYEDGRFEVELPLNHPIYNSFKMKRALFNYYLEPGQTLAMVIDWEEFLLADRFRKGRYHFENIEFYGPLASVNQELASYKEMIFDDEDIKKLRKEISPKEYLKIKTKSTNIKRIELLKFLVTHNISKKVTQILQSKNELDKAITLFNFVISREYDAKQDKHNKALQEPIPKDYFNFLNDIDFNNQSLLVNNNFSLFITHLNYAPVFSNKTNTTISPNNVLEYLLELNTEIPKNEIEAVKANELLNTPEKQKRHNEFIENYQKRLSAFYRLNSAALNKIQKENPNGNSFQILKNQLKEAGKLSPLDEEMLIVHENRITEEEKKAEVDFLNKHGKALRSFKTKYSNINSVLYKQNYYKSRENKMKKILDIDSCLVFDIITLKNNTKQLTTDLIPYTDAELAYYKKDIVNKNIANQLDIENNKLKAKLEVNKSKTGYNINKVEKSEGDELFESMIAKFKGKVIYVDFWATWCGPCMSGIKRIAPLKEEMLGKDVVFLYISAPSSPEKTWENAIPNIKGEHYRVTKDEWNYLKDKFKITGIPHYALVNKKGELINSDLGHKQNSELKKILETELSK
ncbi:hypothetical protein AXE80_08725 [Wenyingzhuangia fucanilytica]|uniref:Thioredoxin domain-containing protein n=1 Tax=Wenyingzhuangia fucanilytica TaxID=1790137 RepID=A0A1B1Y6F4_9FLAO|nr:hypothetical protein AXE80_08725 [Wenyingzhuangia fucanilytica]